MAHRKDLFRTLTRQRLLRLILLLGTLMLAPVAAWSDTGYSYSPDINAGTYTMPSANHPPVNKGSPISVPVKALVERLAFGITEDSYKARNFRYDIDTLGQGMAVRLHFKF